MRCGRGWVLNRAPLVRCDNLERHCHPNRKASQPRIPQMKWRKAFCFFLFCVSAVAQNQATVVNKVDLSSYFPFDIRNSIEHLAFIDDDLIAVSYCEVHGTSRCEIQTLRINGSKLDRVGVTNVLQPTWGLHRSGTTNLLATGFPGREGKLFSSDLKIISDIPDFDRSRISTSGRTFVHYVGFEKWTLYSLNPELKKIRDGEGYPEAVTDNGILVRRGKVLSLESLEGTHLASSAKGIPLDDGNFISGNRVEDFDGRTLSKLDVPKGWGEFTTSSDSSRLLYDTFERRETFWQKLGDIIPNDNAPPNIENIRVLETKTGKVCFDYQQPYDGGGAHGGNGDISPSGKKVAVLQHANLTVYELPVQCG